MNSKDADENESEGFDDGNVKKIKKQSRGEIVVFAIAKDKSRSF